MAYDFIYAIRDMVEKSPGDVSPGEEYALVFRQGSLRPLTRIRLGRPDISGTSGEAVLMATPAGPHALVVEGSTGSPQFEVRLVGLAKGGTAAKLAHLRDDLTSGYYQPPGRPDEEGCQTHAEVRGSSKDLIVCLRASDCGVAEANDFTVRAYAIRGVRFVRVFPAP